MFKPLFVGSPNARHGPTYRYMSLRFYACEGLIVIEDERDGSQVIMVPAKLKKHSDVLADYAEGLRSSDSSAQREIYKQCAQSIRDMRDCVREAKAMGDPSDPAVQEWWSRHRPGSKSTISTKPRTDPAGYPQLPPLPLGKFTGRSVDPDKVGPPLPEGGVVLHQSPRRKSRTGVLLPSDVL